MTLADDLEVTSFLEVELLDTFFAEVLDCFWVFDLLLTEVFEKAAGDIKRVMDAARISETQFFLLNTIILVLF